jgi:hypothetical protein
MTTQQLTFKSLPALPLTEGATVPNLGAAGKGAWAWSDSLSKPVYWTGTNWTAGSSGGGGATDPLELTASTPTAPAADKVRVFARNVGGRIVPAFVGPSGLDTSLQASLARNMVAFARPQGNGTVIAGVGLAISPTGTATAASVSATNLYTAMRRIEYLVNTAATTAVAGFRHAAAQWFRGSGALGGFHFVCRFAPATGSAANATRRGFVGFTSLTTAPTDVDPSTRANIIGVGCDSTDANYFIMHKTGTATATRVDTGIAKSATDRTKVFELAMFCPPGGTSVQFEFTDLTTGVVFRHTATTNLPAATTLLAPSGYYSVGGVSSVIGMALMSLYIETDY